MKEYACPKEQFLRDVSEHVLTVLRDDGVERHLRFRKPGTYCYGFDLLTFPGHLLITGDCGSFLFRRLDDMFQFFRADREPVNELHINPQYWSEKLQATDCNGARGGAARKYAKEVFEENVRRLFDQHFEDEIRDEADPDADFGDDPAALVKRKARRDLVGDQILCAQLLRR